MFWDKDYARPDKVTEELNKVFHKTESNSDVLKVDKETSGMEFDVGGSVGGWGVSVEAHAKAILNKDKEVINIGYYQLITEDSWKREFRTEKNAKNCKSQVLLWYKY